MKLETDGVFDSELLNPPDLSFLAEMDSFLKDPMTALMKILTQSLDAVRPRAFEPFKSEHKVRIFRFNDKTNRSKVAAEIEELLNDGYCCHMPTPCGDFLIMDFSRRKDDERQERQTNNDRSDKETKQ